LTSNVNLRTLTDAQTTAKNLRDIVKANHDDDMAKGSTSWLHVGAAACASNDCSLLKAFFVTMKSLLEINRYKTQCLFLHLTWIAASKNSSDCLRLFVDHIADVGTPEQQKQIEVSWER